MDKRRKLLISKDLINQADFFNPLVIGSNPAWPSIFLRCIPAPKIFTRQYPNHFFAFTWHGLIPWFIGSLLKWPEGTGFIFGNVMMPTTRVNERAISYFSRFDAQISAMSALDQP